MNFVNVIGTAVFVSFAAVAAAQTPPPAPAAPAVPVAGWQDGFFIQTPDGGTRLVFGLTVQFDGRFSTDTPTPITDTFAIRKVRPTLSGRVGRYFEFRAMPDFGSGVATLQDAYFDVRFSPKFRVRTGKDKTPIGYELMMADAYVLFPERSLASGLVPIRDVGVQVLGDLAGGALSYGGGLFNGVPDGTSSVTDVDQNNGKDIAGRLVFQPFKSAQPTGRLAGLGVQIGGSTGRQAGVLPIFRTSSTQTYFTYASNATADGQRTRVTPAIFYYFRSFGGFAEYMRSAQQVSKPGVRANLANDGWDVTGSFVLTGEAASERGVRPSKVFDPANGRWGALQIIARYSTVSLDPDAFASGLASATASPQAKAVAVGLDWYPTTFIKYYATFERTTFGSTESSHRPAEHLVLFRAQIAF